MNKLLSDDSLNQSGKNDLKTTISNDKVKGHTVICGKSGRIVTLPPIETPKTRSLVKKEVCNFNYIRSQYSEVHLFYILFFIECG